MQVRQCVVRRLHDGVQVSERLQCREGGGVGGQEVLIVTDNLDSLSCGGETRCVYDLEV